MNESILVELKASQGGSPKITQEGYPGSGKWSKGKWKGKINQF